MRAPRRSSSTCSSALALALALPLAAGCGSSQPGNDAGADVATDIPAAPPDVGMDVPVDTAPPTPPPVELGRHEVAVVDTRRVIPGEGLPAEVVAMNSNNNLDVVRHSDGRIYLAFRTGPDHYASSAVAMYVMSTTDEVHWRYEARFADSADLREPRLLSLNGSLFLYVARLGSDRLRFEPMGMSFSQRQADGTWSALAPFYQPGFIGWRARTERGTPYLLAYVGGEHIYQMDGIPLSIHMLTTTNGTTWTGVNPANPVIAMGGGSETDFTLGDDGSLYGVIRNEAGDASGWGSYVCHAAPGHITEWQCHNDPRKYDSPLMFWHDGEAYLLARRNVTASGNYDLMMRNMNVTLQTLRYQTDYHVRPKRCSLWRYDQASNRIVYILDLPSAGDTCFAGILAGDRPGDFVVYNYSSDYNANPDVSWLDGQEGPTYIYRSLLRFTPRDVRDR